MEESNINKYANLLNSAKDFFVNSNFGRGILIGAGFMTVNEIANVLNRLISEQYHIYKSQEYYEAMLKEHPQLKQFDPKDVAKYFKSLNHFAPNLAQDPLAAGAYLTQSLKKLSGEELGGPPPDTFNTLVDIQKKISDSKSSRSDTSNKIYQSTAGAIIGSVIKDGL